VNQLKPRRARIAFTALVVVAAVIGAGAAGLVARASTRTTRVTVTEREYKITLSKRTFSPGTVTFLINNRGKLAHSFAIRGPGLSKRISGTIPAGGHRTLTVRLKAGTFSLWCPIHFAMGMKTTLHVKGASSAPTTSSTTGGGGGWG
jgi:plastocyanin